LIAYLYLVKLSSKEEEFIKIGHTVFEDIMIRMNFGITNHYTVNIINKIENSFNIIINQENTFHKKYVNFSYIPKNKFIGYTECYDIKLLDILVPSFKR
jgi:hypothetical protein